MLQSSNGAYRVHSIRLRNVRALTEASVKLPSEGLILVTGVNGAGKTSLGDTIRLAICGGSADQVRMVRHGQPEMEADVDCAAFRAKRVVTADGKRNALDLREADGTPIPEPQTFLDGLIGPLSLQPLDFDSMTGKKRMDFLFGLAGIREKLDDLDGRRAALAIKRRDASRKVRDCAGKLRGMNAPEPGAPTEPTDITSLTTERGRRQEIHDRHAKLTKQLESALEDHATTKGDIERLETQLRLKRQRLEDLEQSGRGLRKTIEEIGVLPPLAEIDDQIAQIGQQNKAAASAKAYLDTVAEREAAEQEVNAHKSDIADIDAEKTSVLTAAKFPVEGLAFDQDVFVNDVAWTELSRSERIRFTVKMGVAANKHLRLIRIETGESMDDAGLRLLDSLGRELGYQIIAEYVTRNGAERHPRETIIVENGTAVNA